MKARIAVAIAALLFIAYGAISGDIDDTWRKASQICLECIGIGR
ncbi:MAG: thioredoxin [Clostridiales bacterium]|nr:thioredoxin [Clostridiales bacterium]MDR2751099.1 thioredoxin [Clostridiales bacterium]